MQYEAMIADIKEKDAKIDFIEILHTPVKIKNIVILKFLPV